MSQTKQAMVQRDLHAPQIRLELEECLDVGAAEERDSTEGESEDLILEPVSLEGLERAEEAE